MSDPYDQRKEDPQGYYFSMAFLAGMLGVALLVDGGRAAPLGLVSLVAAGVLYWKSCRYTA